MLLPKPGAAYASYLECILLAVLKFKKLCDQETRRHQEAARSLTRSCISTEGCSSEAQRLPAARSATGLCTIFTSHSEGPNGRQDRRCASARANGAAANEKNTPYEDITHYNNFYESRPTNSRWRQGQAIRDSPVTVALASRQQSRGVFDIDDLLKISPCRRAHLSPSAASKVYRWNPWVGSAGEVLDQVQPISQAKYVAFETLADRKQMPNISSGRSRLAVHRWLAIG